MAGAPGPCGCGCALTEETSYGFDVDWFAEHVIGQPLDPWQRWAVIHGGELLPDGRPRFRKLLILVARQQGKTHLVKVLTLYWLFVERWPVVLGTHTNLGMAKVVWQEAIELAEATEYLARELPPDAVRKAAGEECLTTVHGSKYRIAASNRRGGRGLSIDRLILDELREHDDWSAWNAAYNAMSARPYGQVVAISNQGDDTGVVLDSLRGDAVKFIETGAGDSRLGLLEWSAPRGANPEDPAALAMANPNMGRRTDAADLLADAGRAVRNGGEELASFLTEILCIRVDKLDPAIDAGAWADCLDAGPIPDRSRVALAIDVAPDQRHATVYAASALADGRVRVDFVADYGGQGCTDALRGALRDLVGRVRPQVVGWLPAGPAASVAADLTGRAGWPASVSVQEIRGDLAAVAMGFAELVAARKVAHSADPLLDAQVAGAERLRRGDVWVYSRRGEGHVDALYAAAAATHLARTLPPPVGKPRLVVNL